MNNISLENIAMTVFVVLGIIFCIYFILLIKNMYESVKGIRVTIQENKENINASLSSMPVILKNVEEISATANVELKAIEATIKSVGLTVENTAATVDFVKNDIVDNIKKNLDLFYALKRVLFKDKKKKSKANNNTDK